MVTQDLPRPPWSVGGLLETYQLPNKIAKALPDWFQVTKNYGISLSLEECFGWGLYTFLRQLASKINPVPRFARLKFLDI